MVTIRGYRVLENSEGESFCMLQLEGEVEMVQSKQTGKYYATVKKCNVPATFDEETCKLMVGKIMPGGIIRIKCDPYQYEIPSNGEIVTLDYTWSYSPNQTEVETLVPDEMVS